MFELLRKWFQAPSPEKVIADLDESFDDTVFVLAGFAAPIDEWEKFSRAWRDALASPPAITALKTRDAMRLSGEFERWTPAERDAKLCLLYKAIDDHVSFGLSALLPIALLQTIDDPRLGKEARNP